MPQVPKTRAEVSIMNINSRRIPGAIGHKKQNATSSRPNNTHCQIPSKIRLSFEASPFFRSEQKLAHRLPQLLFESENAQKPKEMSMRTKPKQKIAKSTQVPNNFSKCKQGAYGSHFRPSIRTLETVEPTDFTPNLHTC